MFFKIQKNVHNVLGLFLTEICIAFNKKHNHDIEYSQKIIWINLVKK